MTSKGANFNNAKKAKRDEFYTQLSDIEKELKHYKKQFKGKVVYCNCDDPNVSSFFRYFFLIFDHLGLKKLIATCYKNQDADLFSQNDTEQAVYLEYEGNLHSGYKGKSKGQNVPDIADIVVKPLKGNGDFRSAESIALLKRSDIVVTNPPFSLFREFVQQLFSYDKKFLIIGTQNAITYKDVFQLFQDNKMWLGTRSGSMTFRRPDENGQKWQSLGNICWYTNLDVKKRHEDLDLYQTYDPARYPSYVNFDGIEVSQIKNIPENYPGAMGVPITFLDKHNPDQFEILGIDRALSSKVPGKPSRFYLSNGKELYARVVIRNKRLAKR